MVFLKGDFRPKGSGRVLCLAPKCFNSMRRALAFDETSDLVFWVWQAWQSTCRLVGSLEPPRESGITWSRSHRFPGVILSEHCVQPPCYVPMIWRFSKIVSGTGGRMRRA